MTVVKSEVAWSFSNRSHNSGLFFECSPSQEDTCWARWYIACILFTLLAFSIILVDTERVHPDKEHGLIIFKSKSA